MGNGVDQKYERFKSGDSALLQVSVCPKNDSGKISDRLGTLKGRFQRFEILSKLRRLVSKIAQVPPTHSKPTPFESKLNSISINIGDDVMMTHYDSFVKQILDKNGEKN